MAYRVIWAEGHYGSTTCSKCKADLDKYEYSNTCPECGEKFDETDSLLNFGGSDF